MKALSCFYLLGTGGTTAFLYTAAAWAALCLVEEVL